MESAQAAVCGARWIAALGMAASLVLGGSLAMATDGAMPPADKEESTAQEGPLAPAEDAQAEPLGAAIDILTEDESLEGAEEGVSAMLDQLLLEGNLSLDQIDPELLQEEHTHLPEPGAEALGGMPPQPREPVAVGQDELFPTSPIIEEQKAFWVQIFAKYTTSQGLLHDGRIAMPVWTDIDLTGLRYRRQLAVIRQEKAKVRQSLLNLAQKMEAQQQPNDDELALLQKMPADVTPRDVRNYARNIRFQRGLADRFEKGLARAGALMPHIRAILREHDVPEDLAYLPHVESSFNNIAYSHMGAAGIWQFTYGTGKLFMEVGYEVDERYDPIVATRSAAKFLRSNYERLGAWPLAITAYNHGPQGLERAVQRTGSTDMGYLVRNYQSRLFRFASKNFYAEFLAARQVAENYQDYFGEVELHEPLAFTTVPLPFYIDFGTAAQVAGLSRDRLAELNPALRSTVRSGAKYIPAGYKLRLPPEADASAFVEAVPAQARHDKQKIPKTVTVQRGDTLSTIGTHLGMSWSAIARANNIGWPYRIYAGDELIIPSARVSDEEIDRFNARKASQQATTASAESGGGGQAKALPVASTAVASGQERLHTEQAYNLRIQEQGDTGRVEVAAGEKLELFAEWAKVSIGTLRRVNGMGRSTSLREGQRLSIPLANVNADAFDKARLGFHEARERRFYDQYTVEVKQYRVARGQNIWNLTERRGIPKWLFYKENPSLVDQPLRAGEVIRLPVLQRRSLTESTSALPGEDSAAQN